MELPKKVTINEVILRDGIQLEEKVLSVEEKQELVHYLLDARATSLEFGSFVHPKAVPQMANSGELYDLIKNLDALNLVALIPNLKGAESAASHGVKRVNFVFSASNTHNLQNVRQSTEQSLERLRTIKEFCAKEEIKLDVSIATSFGCPFEGEVPVHRVKEIVANLTELDANIITFADTTGMANPKQVYDFVRTMRQEFPEQSFNLHFHNTRGMGLSNILAGMEAGITSFDASLGGLGGCPFAPGATGNVCTEDVVHMLHNMGIETGIDLDKLIEASKRLKELIGHDLSSYVLKAGKSDRKYSVPAEA
ncbi:hydroxymethylglutaryl-CoA lyase [Oceanobacillus halophilus]|uniref:Hydroxymethylglutaryl-CoA lyase n=1 Tax=Oceanobacillus halophilus TaxID=930130 RepID=A0A495ABJ5_9BACI|nr:hydroxymethylglutaryl-CoA lyase [Oceanobacillus halophilus]RKQ35796.1 hydroxymethylglutaryl-CoA lyase [Oceanobacillus halophilus]